MNKTDGNPLHSLDEEESMSKNEGNPFHGLDEEENDAQKIP
ncbi:hypothetical protein V7147_23280 [Bacillus sp. JJ1521]